MLAGEACQLEPGTGDVHGSDLLVLKILLLGTAPPADAHLGEASVLQLAPQPLDLRRAGIISQEHDGLASEHGFLGLVLVDLIYGVFLVLSLLLVVEHLNVVVAAVVSVAEIESSEHPIQLSHIVPLTQRLLVGDDLHGGGSGVLPLFLGWRGLGLSLGLGYGHGGRLGIGVGHRLNLGLGGGCVLHGNPQQMAGRGWGFPVGVEALYRLMWELLLHIVQAGLDGIVLLLPHSSLSLSVRVSWLLILGVGGFSWFCEGAVLQRCG